MLLIFLQIASPALSLIWPFLISQIQRDVLVWFDLQKRNLFKHIFCKRDNIILCHLDALYIFISSILIDYHFWLIHSHTPWKEGLTMCRISHHFAIKVYKKKQFCCKHCRRSTSFQAKCQIIVWCNCMAGYLYPGREIIPYICTWIEGSQWRHKITIYYGKGLSVYIHI